MWLASLAICLVFGGYAFLIIYFLKLFKRPKNQTNKIIEIRFECPECGFLSDRMMTEGKTAMDYSVICPDCKNKFVFTEKFGLLYQDEYNSIQNDYATRKLEKIFGIK